MKLSIIMAVFNEERTVHESLQRLLDVDFGVEREVLVCEDGSQDSTVEILKALPPREGLRIEFFAPNRGKGYVIRQAIGLVSGDIITFHDADLELNPAELTTLLQPILAGEADAVYGSRFSSASHHIYWRYYAANRFLAALSNLLYGTRLTDIYTGYKVVKAEYLKAILPSLTANSFAIEAEITARLARIGIRILEYPIHFVPRAHHAGKKIQWRDAFLALWTLLKHRLLK